MKIAFQNENVTLWHGDCREWSGKADAVVSDPPYGMTGHDWDIEPNWESLMPLWMQIGVVVITMQKPKTWAIAARWKPRHHWTWYKSKSSSPALARSGPLRVTEDVLVFGGKVWNPQLMESHPSNVRRNRKNTHFKTKERYQREDVDDVMRKPIDLLDIPSNTGECHAQHVEHPTQKPVELMAYLLRTYTNEGETVLDPYAGSGTTLIAALETGRKAIGIEIDDRWVEVARRRLERWHAQGRLDFGTANPSFQGTANL